MYRRRDSPPSELKNLSDDVKIRKPTAEGTFFTDDGKDLSEREEQDKVTITILPDAVESVNDKITYINEAFLEDIEHESRLQPVQTSQTETSPHLNGRSTPVQQDETENVFKRSKRKTLYWFKIHSKRIKFFLKLLILILYNIYLGCAIHLTWNNEPSYCKGVKFLTILTIMAYSYAVYALVFKTFILKPFIRVLEDSCEYFRKFKHFERFPPQRVTWTITWVAVVIFLIIDSEKNRYRLVSAGGLLVLLFMGFIFSAHPKKVVWKHVQWGVFIQFIISLIILRWNTGREIFQCLGDKFRIFLTYTDEGSSFVFGYLVTGHADKIPDLTSIFAFKVLPVVIFFSFLVSMLYYYGVMQVIVINVGWLLQQTIGTTACESINAAGNIFLGMTEAPLIIRPYLSVMTKSELHAVLTGGFASIAGSVMAAYINFGVSASHLLSASVMSAPAALAFSKLVYPEVEKSVTTSDDIALERGKETNVLEAACNGASTAISLIANIAANLVAFIAFIALINGMLSWFGSLVNWDFLSFEWLLSKIFIPLSLLMGVEWKDSEKVAQLVGLKTIVNEFVAYRKLADFQKERSMSPRSEAIATFALCGFSNIGSIGIQLGSLGAMAPERKSDLARLAVRAMIAGSAACFMTACVAGCLLTDYD